ncbi:hypothetical protein CVT25_001845 [Psilocybe cyanescens]|uniref:Uncharacterized protein n=1 Tax=Psilocybe cyanescens TaxID=93625 RepID=A0A409WQC7_PSICY|nr:hypothetical protein CVT25_001845 [Psilocybe cyanescens]
MIILLLLLYSASQATIHASAIVSRSLPVPDDVRHLTSLSISDATPCSCLQLRSTWDILWSCLVTIFACTWVSIHPNSPGPNARRLRVLLGRVELMIWVILIPEMVISWAFRQWLGARELADYYKGFGWSEVHGHFLQMGGFMLVDGDDDKEVLSPDTFRKLLEEGKIRFPRISQDEISAFSKGDGLSKIMVVGQTSWFIGQCISRVIKGLAITELELVTAAFAFLNALMYFMWWNKPLDSSSTVRIPICRDLIPVSLPPWDHHDQNRTTTVFSTVWPKSHEESNVHYQESHVPQRSDASVECPEVESSPEDSDMDPGQQERKDDALHTTTEQIRIGFDSQSPKDRRTADAEDLSISTPRASTPMEVHRTSSIATAENQPLPHTAETDGTLKGAPGNKIRRSLSLVGYISRLIVRRIQQIRMTKEVPPGAMLVPTFYASSRSSFDDAMKNMTCSLIICLIGVIIGAIHCAGWDFIFPSQAEMLIWRVSSTLIFAYPSIFVLVQLTNIGCYTIFETHTSSGFAYRTIIRGTAFLSTLLKGLPIYLLVKTMLLMEAFIALRHLPDGAFVQVEWTRFLPHI